jgi:hypothetical protein
MRRLVEELLFNKPSSLNKFDLPHRSRLETREVVWPAQITLLFAAL